VFDKVRPGCVDWKKVSQITTSRFKKVENTNYAVILGKSFKFSLVGIQGADLTDGVPKLTLGMNGSSLNCIQLIPVQGLVWQLMREHIIATLKSLTKDGKDIQEADIIAWANAKVAGAGKKSQISSFKDSNLKTSAFFLDLLDSCRQGIIDYKLITTGETEAEQKNNGTLFFHLQQSLPN